MSRPTANSDSSSDNPAAIIGKPVKPVARKFAVSVALLLVLAMCVFWLINAYQTRALLTQQADDLGQALSQQIANQLTELILANDLISMNVVLGGLVESTAIAEVSVLNVDRNMIASASANIAEPEVWVPLPIPFATINGEYSAAIRLAQSVAGFVELRLDLTYIEAALINNLVATAGATLLLVIVAYMLVTTYMQYLISFPANMLAFSLSNIRQGKLETCPEPKGNSEVSTAIRQFNATAEFLAQNTFLSSFSSDIPDEHELQSLERREITLLCIKLSNFQYLASTQSEASVAQLLNKFYFYAGKVTQLYAGRVSVCVEDEVLIHFDDAMLAEEQAFFAACAGQLFLQLVDDLCQLDDGVLPAKFRLAVHSGEAVTNLYSPITETNNIVSGRTLDLTRQLCNACPDNSLLLSAQAFELTGSGSRIEANDYGEIGDGGISGVGDLEPLVAYIALEPMPDYRVLLERQATQLASLYAA